MKSQTYSSIFNPDNGVEIIRDESPFIITIKNHSEENVAPEIDMYHIDKSSCEASHLGELYPVINTNTYEVRMNTIICEEDGSDQVILLITDDIEAGVSKLWDHRWAADKS